MASAAIRHSSSVVCHEWLIPDAACTTINGLVHQWRIVQASTGYDVVTPGEHESHIIVLESAYIESDDRKVRVFVVDRYVLLIFQFINKKSSLFLHFFHAGGKGCQAGIVVGPCLEPFRHPPGMEK